MPATLAATVLLAAGSLAGAGASTDPYAKAAAVVVCPAAPHGWFKPAAANGGRQVQTPLTAKGNNDHPDQLYGGYAAEVDCHYFAAANRQLEVSVRYALGTDISPVNDFSIGCAAGAAAAGLPTGASAWDERTRLYRVVAPKSWSYATFNDTLRGLTAVDAAAFEGVAQAMLAEAQSLAHTCNVAGAGKPVELAPG